MSNGMSEHESNVSGTIFLWAYVISAFLIALMVWGWFVRQSSPPPPEVSEWADPEIRDDDPNIGVIADSVETDRISISRGGVSHRMIPSPDRWDTGCSILADGGFAMEIDGETVWANGVRR